MKLDPSTLEALIGTDDEPGILDRCKVETLSAGAAGTEKPVIIWRCYDGCGGNGNGYVGVIARDMNLSQAGLTLGEMVEAALRHREEEHGEGDRG